jgi:iron complex outermembrane recepter protein
MVRPPSPLREPARPSTLVTEVIVTATKRPTNLDHVPGGVSAISRDQLRVTGATDVGRTVGQMAGVVTTNLGPGRDKLLIRGLSDGAFTGRTRSTVSTYLDNTPINYNAPDPDLRLVDIERVEVLRGPQGALYGSGAVSGIYRIVTRKPNLAEAEVGLEGGLSQTHGGDASRQVEGYVSLPLVRDRLAARLTAYDDLQGGYLDNISLRITNVDATRRNGGRLAVRLKVNERWQIDALAASQHLRSNDTQYVTDLPRGQRANRLQEAHNNDFAYAGITMEGAFDWGGVTSSTAYVHHVFSSQFDASAALDIFAARREDLGVYVEAARVDMIVQDLVLHSRSDSQFEWLVGAYLARTVEETPSSLKILSTDRDSSAYSEFRKDRLSEYALYGEASYAFATNWRATLGGRGFTNRVHTTADITVQDPFRARDFDRSRKFKGFSPKIVVERQFGGGALAYALVSQGYRPGGFNSSGFQPIRASRITYAPDQLRNYEIGANARSRDGRLSLRTAAYLDDWQNIQTDQYRPSGLAYTANVADARILGLEAEASIAISPTLNIQLNGLVSTSRIRNANPDFAETVTGSLPGVPGASGGLLVVYQRPVGEHLTLKLAGEASYIGRSSLSFDAQRSSRMGHYIRSQVTAELSTERWRATAFVNNPLNDSGDTFAYGNPFSFGQVRQVTPQRPRTVGVRLSATF